MHKWSRGDDYYIRSGEWTICKKFLDGCTLYELWHGKTLHGHFNDAAEAKEIHERLCMALDREASQ